MDIFKNLIFFSAASKKKGGKFRTRIDFISAVCYMIRLEQFCRRVIDRRISVYLVKHDTGALEIKDGVVKLRAIWQGISIKLFQTLLLLLTFTRATTGRTVTT